MIRLGFEPNFEVDYGYMRKYRTRSIATFYIKELISAAFICTLSVFIWFEYVSVFREKDIYWILNENEETGELEAEPCWEEECFYNDDFDFATLPIRTGMS